MPANRYGKLTDESIFPFGDHNKKGTKMKDVPSSYLDWFMGMTWAGDWPNIVEYVNNNRAAIDQDLEQEGRI